MELGNPSIQKKATPTYDFGILANKSGKEKMSLVLGHTHWEHTEPQGYYQFLGD